MVNKPFPVRQFYGQSTSVSPNHLSKSSYTVLDSSKGHNWMTPSKPAGSEYIDLCQDLPLTSGMTSLNLQFPHLPSILYTVKYNICQHRVSHRITAFPHSECLLDVHFIIPVLIPCWSHTCVRLVFTYFTGICPIFPARQGSLRVRALSCSSLIFPTTQCFEHSRQFNAVFVELSWFFFP